MLCGRTGLDGCVKVGPCDHLKAILFHNTSGATMLCLARTCGTIIIVVVTIITRTKTSETNVLLDYV